MLSSELYLSTVMGTGTNVKIPCLLWTWNLTILLKTYYAFAANDNSSFSDSVKLYDTYSKETYINLPLKKSNAKPLILLGPSLAILEDFNIHYRNFKQRDNITFKSLCQLKPVFQTKCNYSFINNLHIFISSVGRLYSKILLYRIREIGLLAVASRPISQYEKVFSTLEYSCLEALVKNYLSLLTLFLSRC